MRMRRSLRSIHPLTSAALRDAFVWRDLIFARQCLIAFAHLRDLPRKDRLTPILAAIEARGESFNDVWVEAPDSDEGKALAPLCKSFGNALIGALRQRGKLDTKAPRRLHVFFPKGDAVFLAAGDDSSSAPWPLGIPRLKFPREAPSRSTLKLEEAFLVLLTPAERERWLKPGMTRGRSRRVARRLDMAARQPLHPHRPRSITDRWIAA